MGVIRALQLKANELIVNPNSSSSSFFISRISVRQLHSSITQATADARLHSGEGDDEDEDQPTRFFVVFVVFDFVFDFAQAICSPTPETVLHPCSFSPTRRLPANTDVHQPTPSTQDSGEGDDEDEDQPTR
ncbi:hypothetical protein Dimus_028545 [Dionaea muscipula]